MWTVDLTVVIKLRFNFLQCSVDGVLANDSLGSVDPIFLYISLNCSLFLVRCIPSRTQAERSTSHDTGTTIALRLAAFCRTNI